MSFRVQQAAAVNAHKTQISHKVAAQHVCIWRVHTCLHVRSNAALIRALACIGANMI